MPRPTHKVYAVWSKGNWYLHAEGRDERGLLVRAVHNLATLGVSVASIRYGTDEMNDPGYSLRMQIESQDDERFRAFQMRLSPTFLYAPIPGLDPDPSVGAAGRIVTHRYSLQSFYDPAFVAEFLKITARKQANIRMFRSKVEPGANYVPYGEAGLELACHLETATELQQRVVEETLCRWLDHEGVPPSKLIVIDLRRHRLDAI
jgi:hypothetical protein